MVDNNLLSKITDIIIQHTVKKRIPTLVIISDINKGDLIRHVINKLYGSKENIFADFSSIPWEKIADIMQKLAEIPLLLKEINDINDIRNETENFIETIGNGNGLVIINSDNDMFTPDFTKKENISIIGIDV